MTHPFTVLIADDEPNSLLGLRATLEGRSDVSIVACCHDGPGALRALQECKPQIALLDIRMPGATGLEVLHAVPRSERPAVIFTTAFRDFALEAFDLEAVDYLLKPFSDARLEEALTRAKQRIQGRAVAGTAPEPFRLAIPTRGRTEFVQPEDLVYIEAAAQYSRLFLERGEVVARISLRELEANLPAERFLRIHRSYIVPKVRIVSIETQAGGTGHVTLRGGQCLPVSRSRIALVRRLLGSE
ncbi:MAG: LytTR family DNA-binding domain-containing protein [Planctomycetota bacterium]